MPKKIQGLDKHFNLPMVLLKPLHQLLFLGEIFPILVEKLFQWLSENKESLVLAIGICCQECEFSSANKSLRDDSGRTLFGHVCFGVKHTICRCIQISGKGDQLLSACKRGSVTTVFFVPLTFRRCSRFFPYTSLKIKHLDKQCWSRTFEQSSLCRKGMRAVRPLNESLCSITSVNGGVTSCRFVGHLTLKSKWEGWRPAVQQHYGRKSQIQTGFQLLRSEGSQCCHLFIKLSATMF